MNTENDVQTISQASETTATEQATVQQAEGDVQGQTETASPKSNTLAIFNESLEAFVRTLEDNKRFARICADMGLDHFAAHQDLIYLQRFLDKISSNGKNYVRKAAFLQWCMDFAPIKESEGKLTKDKASKVWDDPQAKADLIEKAHAVAFWDHKPDTEQVYFGNMEYLKAMAAAHKKFKGDRYHATGNRVGESMKEMEALLDRLSGGDSVQEKAA